MTIRESMINLLTEVATLSRRKARIKARGLENEAEMLGRRGDLEGAQRKKDLANRYRNSYKLDKPKDLAKLAPADVRRSLYFRSEPYKRRGSLKSFKRVHQLTRSSAKSGIPLPKKS